MVYLQEIIREGFLFRREVVVNYIVGLAIGAILIVSGWYFVRTTRTAMQTKAVQAVPEAKQAGVIEQDADLRELGFEMTSSELLRVQIADLLAVWKVPLIAAVALASVALPALLSRWRGS